jgi:2-methylfumaryl-CoA isomerase
MAEEDAVTPGPLAGLHILDITSYVAGPSGMMTLGQLGADVVRVDPLGGASDTRRMPLDGAGNSLYWLGLNKAKRSVTVDFSTEDGRDIVRRLISVPEDGYGIVVTNSVGQDWLTYDQLRKCRDDLIHVHIEGRGPDRAAVDYTVNPEVGLPFITGSAQQVDPVNHVLPAWDLLTGLHAAVGVLTAERVRRATGQGQGIRVALADVAVATMAHLGFVADAAVNSTARVRDGNFLYGTFGCDFVTADGRRVMVVALTPRHWRNLTKSTNLAGPLDALAATMSVDFADERVRYQYREMIAAILRPWFAARSYADATSVLEATGVLWGAFRSVTDLVDDPESLLRTSPVVQNVEQDGIGTYPVPGSVLRMSGTPAPPPAAAHRLGVDTDDVLAEWLGA